MSEEADKAKAEAKKAEAEKIAAEREKRQGKIPGTDPAGEAKKRGPGRPPGKAKPKPEGVAPKTRQKRKPAEEIVDTDKALRQWFKDGKKLVALHKKKHPGAKVGAVDPFTVEREPLKMEEKEVVGLTHFSFNLLGNFMRVPSAVPGEDKLDMMGKAWARALPYMNLDAGKVYIAIACVMTGAVLINMTALSVARLLGKYKDPLVDDMQGEFDQQFAIAGEDELAFIERQVEAQAAAVKAAADKRRAELREQAAKGHTVDGKRAEDATD